MADSDLLDAFGDFDIEVDDSAAQARAERIEAARRAGQNYEAKIEEPGWFNDPVQVARSKGPARPALFALHQRYFQQCWAAAVEEGIALERAGVKEEAETRDLVMRAALRGGMERRGEVLEMAKKWREFPNLPTLSFVSAKILFANSPLSPSFAPSSSSHCPTPPPTKGPPTTHPAEVIPPLEVLEASLAALRLHPLQPLYHPLLASCLRPSHLTLAAALEDRKVAQERRTQVEEEVGKVEVSEQGRATLRQVLRLDGEEKEDEEEGVGRDVRSL
ncbi:hypothetical protein JCM11251_001878 [Rhodosporidiobolus azoricus]